MWLAQGGAELVFMTKRSALSTPLEAQPSGRRESGGWFSTSASFPWGTQKTTPASTVLSVVRPSVTSRPSAECPLLTDPLGGGGGLCSADTEGTVPASSSSQAIKQTTTVDP